jgi:hypothetical protein
VASAATWENLKTTCTLTDKTFDVAHHHNGSSGALHSATTVVAVRHIMLQQL